MQGVNIEEVITLLLSNGEDPSEVFTSLRTPCLSLCLHHR